jgi:hypothetical protein
VKLGDRGYKNHLDGYDQMDLLLGNGPSARHEIFCFAGPKLGALRVDDYNSSFFSSRTAGQGEKVTTDMPGMVNRQLRLANSLANENLEAAELNQDASMTSGPTGIVGLCPSSAVSLSVIGT